MNHLVGKNLRLTELGKYRQLLVRCGSYLLPYCQGKMAELSHQEVFTSFYLPRERKVYKRVRVVFRSGEVDVVEVGLFFYRFSLI